MSDYKFDDDPLTTENFFKKLSDAVDEPEVKPKNGKQPTDATKLLHFIRGDEYMATDFPEQEWTIEGVVPKQGLVCFSGMPSSYKSWFVYYMALCIMRGEPVLANPLVGYPGWKTDKGSVLFIDKENVDRQIVERLKMLGAGEEMKNCYFTQGNFTTENISSLADVVAMIKEHKISTVIIDSLIRVHSRNENEAVEMNKVFERLLELQHAGATVIYIHHLRKATNYSKDPMERLRGSIDISARLDSLVAFENDEKNIIKVHHGKSRYTQAFPSFIMRFEVDQHKKAFFNYEKELDPGQIEEMLCTEAVYEVLKENSYTRKHLVEKLSGHYSEIAIDKAVSDLHKEGKIEKHRQGHETIYSINKLYEFTKKKLTKEEKEDLN